MNKLLIIIPAYNEEKNIERVVKQIKQISDNYDIVIINDGSLDNTAKIAQSLDINLISHPINLGAGAAIKTGLTYAAENHYRMAVIIDGDGQHSPQELPKLVASMQESQADVVIGSRFLKKSSGNIHWARQIGIFLFSKIVLIICRQKITDTTSGYRLYNFRAINYLAQEIPLDFPDADMLISLILAGFKIIEVPVTINERRAGDSMYSLLRSTYYPFKISISIVAILIRKIFSWRKKQCQ